MTEGGGCGLQPDMIDRDGMVFRTATLCTLLLGGCVLDPKNLGEEPGTSDGGVEGGTAGACQPGDTMPAPDGCNTCGCIDGEWACTQIGCGETGTPTECQPGDTMPAPDGCNDCICIEGQWGCTKRACGETSGSDAGGSSGAVETGGSDSGGPGGGWFGDEILICDPGAPTDTKVISAAAVVGDSLAVTVTYSGGCEEHLFGLCWDGAFAESNPVQVSTFISHDSMQDPCDALPSEELIFDLLPLRAAYESSYQSDTGAIIINLDGWETPLTYGWGI